MSKDRHKETNALTVNEEKRDKSFRHLEVATKNTKDAPCKIDINSIQTVIIDYRLDLFGAFSNLSSVMLAWFGCIYLHGVQP